MLDLKKKLYYIIFIYNTSIYKTEFAQKRHILKWVGSDIIKCLLQHHTHIITLIKLYIKTKYYLNRQYDAQQMASKKKPLRTVFVLYTILYMK